MSDVAFASPRGPQTFHPGWEPPALEGMSQDEVHHALREQVKSSTYAMAKGVLGFKDLTAQTHLPFCQFIDSPTKRKFALAPRDHLKTSIFTIADIVRRIVCNPNVRILIGNETATNASKMLTRVEAVFERNALFQWLFPELIPDFAKVKRWSSAEMLVPRSDDYVESTLEAIGVGGAIVGRHYDVIKLDDLVGKEASESEEIMKKTIDWYQLCEPLLDNPAQGSIHVYGTRWNFWDLYAWVDEFEAGIDRFYRSAILPDGTALWPERFPLEELDRLRLKLGGYKFSCQYLNDPKDEQGKSFQTSWLRWFSLEGGTCRPELGDSVPTEKLRKYMRVDPAISEASDAARTAIVVDGVDHLDRKFLLETWAKRCQPLEMIDQIFRLSDKWHCEAVGFESVAYQKIIKPFLEHECLRRNRWLNIVELRPDTHQKKQSRIMGAQPYCERGEIYVQKDDNTFLDEYKRFPFGKTMDVMDAWAYGPRMWEAPELEAEGLEDEVEWEFDTAYAGRLAATGY